MTGGLAASSGVRTWFRVLSVSTALSTFGLVILGGVVRVTDSGLGCPDWPLCQGGVIPPWEVHAIIEYAHRIVASVLVGPLVLATCVATWIFYRPEKWLLVPATFGLALLFGQGLLGGITVVNELPGSIVAAHLALGETLLACMILIAVVAYCGPLQVGKLSLGSQDRFPLLALIAGVALFALLMSGSYVTVSGSTGACLDWPLCQGSLIPEHKLQIIHMAHRLAAAFVGLFVLYTVHQGFRGRGRAKEVRLLSFAVAVVFLVQVASGAIAVWRDFPQDIRILHLALATVTWGALAALAIVSQTKGGTLEGEGIDA